MNALKRPWARGTGGASSSKCVNYGTLLNRESTYPANFSLALGPVANGGFLFKQPFKTKFQNAPTQASIPTKHGGMLAKRASTWPRDHF